MENPPKYEEADGVQSPYNPSYQIYPHQVVQQGYGAISQPNPNQPGVQPQVIIVGAHPQAQQVVNHHPQHGRAISKSESGLSFFMGIIFVRFVLFALIFASTNI